MFVSADGVDGGGGGLDNNENCPLMCLNGSTCKSGSANFEDHPDDGKGNALDIHEVTNIENYYCDCLPGFTGVACSIPFESCADSDSKHVCYHGGACIPGGADEFGMDQYYCDCTHAIITNETSTNHYVGKYCEYVQPEESMCNADLSGQHSSSFCVNGGICSTSVMGDPTCSCPTGFTGIHCQYRKHEVPTCDLQCQNGGTCQIGLSPASNGGVNHAAAASNANFQYCQCTDDYIGATCDDEDGVPCGSHKCYHGSECVIGEDSSTFCDCTAANVLQPDKHFAGRYCHYEATTYCSTTKDYFCVNGGECYDKGNGIYGCICGDEWAGPSCEFESADRDHHYENCTMTCYNGGECRKGAKDMASILGVAPELSHLVNVETHGENFEHCVCPTGFTGLQCEHKYEECGIGEHICLFGSKCVEPQNSNHPVWTCECEEAFQDDRKYAGKFCQHHHTSICTTDDAQSGVYQGSSTLTFCVNDGTCTEIVEDGESRPGCDCPNSYTGLHCELLKGGLPSGSGNNNNNNPLRGDPDDEASVIFACIILSIMLVTMAVFIFVRAKIRKQRTLERIRREHLREQYKKDLGRQMPSTLADGAEYADEEDEAIMEEIELL